MSDANKKIRKLPELKLSAGLNKYAIDLSENSSFKKRPGIYDHCQA
jgi:hypothetical protein